MVVPLEFKPLARKVGVPVPTPRTGKDGRVAAGGTVYITNWKAKLKKNTADSTDTSAFDGERAWRTQLAVDYSVEGSIEGYYDFAGSGAVITANLYSNNPLSVTLSFDRNTNFGSGNFDFTDVEIGVPRDNIITFTATIVSNGPFALA